jgi:aminoglycoside phosphotransferase (APT) family kinase protein
MPQPDPDRVSWLVDGSAASVRSALKRVAPSLAEGSIAMIERLATSNPNFFQGRAVFDGTYVVKFAWSEVPARRLVHEANVLRALARAAPTLPIPRLVITETDPVLLVTEMVSGVVPDYPGTFDAHQRTRLGRDLGRFLEALHDRALLGAVRNSVLGPPWEPQGDTPSIRARFPTFVDTLTTEKVMALCDFADEALAGSALGLPRDEAVLHGDLHPGNTVIVPENYALRLVADFETTSIGDPNFDFRYLPDVGGDTMFFEEVRAAYEGGGSRTIDVRRVMGWYIRTYLGDALWRSEAFAPLPGGGNATNVVERVIATINALGFEVS